LFDIQTELPCYLQEEIYHRQSHPTSPESWAAPAGFRLAGGPSLARLTGGWADRTPQQTQQKWPVGVGCKTSPADRLGADPPRGGCASEGTGACSVPRHGLASDSN